MLDFCDEPYREFLPHDSWLWRALLGWYNRRRFLPQAKRITELTVHGADTLRQSCGKGDRLVLMPNHPTHADAARHAAPAHRSHAAAPPRRAESRWIDGTS